MDMRYYRLPETTLDEVDALHLFKNSLSGRELTFIRAITLSMEISPSQFDFVNDTTVIFEINYFLLLFIW